MSLSTEALVGALNAGIQQQEIIARNIANVETVGFKRNIALMESGAGGAGSAGTPAITGTGVDLSQGALQATHNDMDFAVDGEGFFALQTKNGEMYTRNGSFRLNENRILVTQGGDAVLGDSGEIQIPENAREITVSPSGELRADSVAVAQLRITAFDRPEMLRQMGDTRFRDEGAAPRPAGDFKVQQGFVESSNVSSIAEIVRMMSNMRDYEASTRSLRSIEDSAAKLYAWARG